MQSSDAAPQSALLFVEGAPGIIKKMVQTASLPLDFDKVDRQRWSLQRCNPACRVKMTGSLVVFDAETIHVYRSKLCLWRTGC